MGRALRSGQTEPAGRLDHGTNLGLRTREWFALQRSAQSHFPECRVHSLHTPRSNWREPSRGSLGWISEDRVRFARKGVMDVSLFPMFVKLEGRSCLVVGAGAIGEGKIRSFLEAGASVWVVSPRATPPVHEWAATGAIKWLRRKFKQDDLAGKFLVIAATSSAKVNACVFEEARKRK